MYISVGYSILIINGNTQDSLAIDFHPLTYLFQHFNAALNSSIFPIFTEPTGLASATTGIGDNKSTAKVSKTT